MSLIQLEHISKIYTETGAQKIQPLTDLNFHMDEGQFIAVMGRSGSGKSTLLNIIGLLLSPTSGSYKFEGTEVSSYTEKEKAVFRRRNVGFVFQKYQLIQDMSIWENICMPCYLDHKKPDRDFIYEAAEKMGLMERLDSYPAALSGGEQQRVAIIRAMANHPKVILADEPTGNLDYATGQQVMEAITVSKRTFGQTILMVTHDNETASYADQILYMQDGVLSGL